MKNLLAIVLFCLPAFGQAAYSGSTLYQSAATYGAVVCGPPTYSCFNMSTTAVPLPAQIPVWGTTNTPANNTNCTSSNPYLFQQCGNLVGAGMVQTPSDFGMPIVRCTDATTLGYASFWGTRDNGEPNIFASDDSWVSVHYGNSTVVLAFNGSQCAASGITYGEQNVQASHTQNNIAYSLAGLNAEQLDQDTYTMTGGFANAANWSKSSTMIFDFITSCYNGNSGDTNCTAIASGQPLTGNYYNCLQNPYNGYPGWTPSGDNWTSVFTTSQDDTVFMESYGNDNIANSVGVFLAVWKPAYGLNGGCDIWNTVTGTLWKHDGSCNVTTPCPMTYQSYPTAPATGSFSVSSVAAASGGNTAYTGTFAGGGGNAYVNYSFVVSGTCAGDNGTFTAVASTATTLTLNNASGVACSTAGTTVGTQVGPDMFKQHEAFASAGDSYILADASAQNYMLNGVYSEGPWVWVEGTTTIAGKCGLYPTTYCTGHFGEGYNGIAVGEQWHAPFTSPNNAANIFGAGIDICADDHFSWNHVDTATQADDYPVMIGWQDVGGTHNLLGGSTPPCPYYDEIDLTQTSGTLPGTTWRAAHNFNSGWSWNFEAQNAIALESYTGKYAVWVTDGEGQFGSTSNAAACNVGGPDWQKSDSTDFATYSGSGPGTFSNYIMPQNGGNNGNFIYQVQSCSGAPCATGPTEPAFPQGASATVTETSPGNITWVNTNNVSNCRSDILIVKLYGN